MRVSTEQDAKACDVTLEATPSKYFDGGLKSPGQMEIKGM